MKYDLFSVLELCGMGGAIFWLIGAFALLVASRKARREFRVKGYLKPPSGTGWFPFLLGKHYEAFENPGTRFYFGISHFCLMGLILVVAAIVILLACTFFFNGLSGFPESLPTPGLPGS